MRIVIIGNGVAGMEAALAVRSLQPDWPITVVSEESENFFSRTALMWVLCGQMSHADIEPQERDAYARHGFTRVRARALGVDTAAKQVLLAGDHAPLDYDRLLIASGSRPRLGPWPGSDLRGVGSFVTHQDLAWLQAELHGERHAAAPPLPRAHLQATAADSPYVFRPVAAEQRGRTARAPAVIGGGLIGIEAVEVCLAAGLKPHFFIREEWFWPVAVEPREARWITDRMAEHGVQVHLEHEVEKLEGDGAGNVTAICTDHGRYEVDCVTVAIGVMPNTEWLGDADIARERGALLVDNGLSTDAEGVYAAGDCAAVRWFDGSRRPEQLWYTARDQGRVAGAALAGQPGSYERGLWYNSAKLMDIEYTTCGLVNMCVKGERNWFFEERGEVRSTTRVVCEGERVIGFNLLGRRWDHEVLSGWIRGRASLPHVLAHLEEAAFDTEFVPPLRLPESALRQALEGPAPNPYVRGPNTFPGSW